MSAADRRSVGELVADCDLLARQSLFDLTPAEAPAMVRAWPRLAQAAASLFSVLPPETNSWAGDDPMARIAEVGAAVGRSVAAGHWPGSGPAAEIFDEITTDLTRAATMVDRPAHGPGELADQLASGGPQIVRTQLMHAVYVTAHATATALAGYQHDLERSTRLAPIRRQLHSDRPNALEIEAAAGMRARFDVIEQLATGHIASHQKPAQQPTPTGPGRRATSRLDAALAAWDVQAHRTLARRPDPADLVRVARVQALIATTTAVITQAAARRGELDPGLLERLTPALEAAQLGWARTARRWGELTNPASRTDPALTDAAAELRAVIAATTANRTGWASPDQIAERIDLPVAMQALHLGMAAGLDLAYVNRDVAADHPGLAAPARVIALRAQGEAEIAAEQGDTRYEGLTWATPKQLATNQLIPLPEPARRGLIDSTDDVITAVTHAVAVAAELNPRDRQPPDRPCSPSSQARSGTRKTLARLILSEVRLLDDLADCANAPERGSRLWRRPAGGVPSDHAPLSGAAAILGATRVGSRIGPNGVPAAPWSTTPSRQLDRATCPGTQRDLPVRPGCEVCPVIDVVGAHREWVEVTASGVASVVDHHGHTSRERNDRDEV